MRRRAARTACAVGSLAGGRCAARAQQLRLEPPDRVHGTAGSVDLGESAGEQRQGLGAAARADEEVGQRDPPFVRRVSARGRELLPEPETRSEVLLGETRFAAQLLGDGHRPQGHGDVARASRLRAFAAIARACRASLERLARLPSCSSVVARFCRARTPVGWPLSSRSSARISRSSDSASGAWPAWSSVIARLFSTASVSGWPFPETRRYRASSSRKTGTAPAKSRRERADDPEHVQRLADLRMILGQRAAKNLERALGRSSRRRRGGPDRRRRRRARSGVAPTRGCAGPRTFRRIASARSSAAADSGYAPARSR